MTPELVEAVQGLKGLIDAAMTEGRVELHCKLPLIRLALYIGP